MQRKNYYYGDWKSGKVMKGLVYDLKYFMMENGK